MNERGLFAYWNDYINRDIYRVISEEYFSDMTKNGLNPQNDPFTDKYNEIESLFELMLSFEKKGIVYQENWTSGPVTASKIIEVNHSSRANNYLDFVVDYKQALRFYTKWSGGALTTVVFNFSNFLQNQELSHTQRQLVEKQLQWSNEKRQYKNRIIAVNGSNTVFENAKLLVLPRKGEKQMLPSLYGSFEHFSKIIKEQFNVYHPYFTLKELSYLRVTDSISAQDIKIIV